MIKFTKDETKKFVAKGILLSIDGDEIVLEDLKEGVEAPLKLSNILKDLVDQEISITIAQKDSSIIEIEEE